MERNQMDCVRMASQPVTVDDIVYKIMLSILDVFSRKDATVLELMNWLCCQHT